MLFRSIVGTELANKAKAEEMRTMLHLRAIRRSNDTGYHYFIANLTPNDVDAYVNLAVKWRAAMWFNPLNGERYAVERKDGKIRVALKSGESMILETFNKPIRNADLLQPRQYVLADAAVKEIDTPWQLSFSESAPKVTKTWTLDKPRTWEGLDDDSVKVTMGTGVYTTTLNLNKEEAQKHWAIDLGDVRESARVYVNGQFIGCAWAAPFILDCSNSLRKGKNEIRIEVTNLPANRIADYDRRDVKWRIMKDINVVDLNYKRSNYASWKPVASGLNSVVKLIELQ